MDNELLLSMKRKLEAMLLTEGTTDRVVALSQQLDEVIVLCQKNYKEIKL